MADLSVWGGDASFIYRAADGRRMPDFPCPSCGKPMDQGYLVAESLLGGAKWMQERTRLAIGGEPIQTRDAWGNVYLAGLRCTACRLITLRY